MTCERRPGYEPFVGRWPQDKHRLRLADPEFTYLVGEAESHGIGFAILHRTWMRPQNLYLKRIAVHDAGRGHGKRLLSALTDWVFAKTDTHRFWLEVVEHNERARGLYRGLGWKEEGLVREGYFDDRLLRRGSFVQMSILSTEWRQ
ncbi:MAG: GNAT family N-acetyltransferase [Alphaproteobacteria bacterium]|nr:GNAT family N-acetyltransferase [Alphaproteobacteria bacterium]